MERLIHISAKSEIYSVFELVPEKKAVKRLLNIKKSFEFLNSRTRMQHKLVVNTCVHNPELPFKNV